MANEVNGCDVQSSLVKGSNDDSVSSCGRSDGSDIASSVSSSLVGPTVNFISLGSLTNDLNYVEWDVKPCSTNQPSLHYELNHR